MRIGKKILVGVTGSIAAYKSATLIRLLIKAQAEVRVVMTPSATTFITPLTLATLSKNPVWVDFEHDKTGVWHNHVELGLWADALIIAPASANTLAKCASGQADNLLIATYLSAKCPVFFAPAMDLDMYKHPASRQNLTTLQTYGNHIIPAESGDLASGLVGEGRMAEPEHIVAFLAQFWSNDQPLRGKKVLLTAGPTCESIDPVRYITNHSTGKMGYAFAEAFAQAGAEVVLVSGPTALATQHPHIQKISVFAAEEMHTAVMAQLPQADIIMLAAAVADYKPKTQATQKIKKTTDKFQLELTKTVDIAQAVGQNKAPHQFVVGFALETQNELQNALDKLKRKNLDAILLNSLNDPGAGFGHDTNQITLIDKNQQQVFFPLQSKQGLAQQITHWIAEQVVST
ncbi:MAG TPA: bifunctional phosphopantothenoylcysteine decarboxylase/phosphopantothenate--cysteine ligase CoaBC [Microscillaceae bacterium]|jgi:phosphopantothenoylcysteine decarboxylase/phosphopantothenate--cysteine ligase|nr:bifunctional phosphopantothenoylcysteine decarboxylase/phosphopantothenate--cysteine ligase CoaBC [Microscillaceae bacterium]